MLRTLKLASSPGHTQLFRDEAILKHVTELVEHYILSLRNLNVTDIPDSYNSMTPGISKGYLLSPSPPQKLTAYYKISGIKSLYAPKAT